ncbi:tetratricopeptide repeat-containing sulfotransferase family protein [Sphingomonas sp. LY160]|uniref:tetratricopeptide repeat-containing sulfotransferase family protein n=1 Tax=Sphingomonas sp. LY160 TaxID=3095342 RepID=UPI002ADEE5EB|nr:sulfotransferase [Sphingomonas sp. LY160]MEA1073099.1 sulfotransferase [Sphingomonas sp. LY160]
MTSLHPEARKAIDLARAGQTDAAIEAALAALDHTPGDAGLTLFLGLLYTRASRLNEAADQFRSALALNPGDVVARTELTRLLIAFDRLDEAQRELAAIPHGIGRKRIKALLLRRRGQHQKAADLYRQAVAADDRDFESWGNLGVCLLAMGRPNEADEALTKSLTLRRDQQVFRQKWAEAQVAAGTGENALERAWTFARENPTDTLVFGVIARLHTLLDRPEQAREAVLEGLSRHADDQPLLIMLADLAEKENRIDELVDTLRKLDRLGVPNDQLQLLKARLSFRQGDFETALTAARDAPGGADPGGKAHLLGLIQDRIDDPGGAFASFVAMNWETAREVPEPAAEAVRYRKSIAERAKLSTRDLVRRWRRAPFVEDRPAPIFMIGFPRSGTTLLDTLLMGHPDLAIAEELPILGEVAEAMGGYERLADLEPNEIETLRALYFARADQYVRPKRGQMIVDKLPLGAIETPLIHRLFPEARFIFVQRHPCDLVLSGFMTRFQPVGGMSNFLTIEDTAKLYDRVMDFWRQCRAVLPLLVHIVRYERLVEDIEAEMRPLASFLNLKWTPRLLDHRRAAKARGFIATPSYAQIQEPINDRAINRWHRYRDQMEPVFPILKPWADAMGYEI